MFRKHSQRPEDWSLEIRQASTTKKSETARDGWSARMLAWPLLQGRCIEGPHPSNPLMRRRVLLARDASEYKADGTSRDRSPLPHDSVATMCEPRRSITTDHLTRPATS